MSEFPRVMLVTPSIFNPRTGGGVTLTTLFKGWPVDCIAAAHSDPEPPSTDICSTYYELGSRELGWVRPFSWLERFRPGAKGPVSVSEVLGTPSPAQSAAGKSHRLYNAVRSMRDTIAREGLNDRATLTPALEEWATRFRPQVIYTLLGNLGYIRLVHQLAERTGTPVVIHMMDDWPTVSYRKGVLAGLFARTMRHGLQELISNARACLGICPAMCDEYAERYGRPFVWFSNAIEREQWMPLARSAWEPTEVCRLVYVGSIVRQAQLTSLHDICRTVDELVRQGVPVEVEIRSGSVSDPAVIHEFASYAATRFRGPIGRAEVPRFLANADVLLLPVNFDPESAAYIRYSNPTKLPEYLAIGTPILAYGPRGVDQIERSMRDGWGLTVPDRDAGALRDAVVRLATDVALRERLGRAAQRVAWRDHDAARVRTEFQQVLQRAAGDGGVARARTGLPQ